MPGPGSYDSQQYDSVRSRVRDALILPEKGARPCYSPAATADTQSATQYAAHRCAPLALAPLPLIFSYKSEKSLCGTG